MKAPTSVLRSSQLLSNRSICSTCRKELRRAASTQANPGEDGDMEFTSFNQPPPSESDAKKFDPLKSSRTRKLPLPPSKYVTDSSESLIHKSHICVSRLWTNNTSIDISIVLPDTIVALLHHIDLLHLQTLHLDNLFPDLFHNHGSKPPTTTPLRPIS